MYIYIVHDCTHHITIPQLYNYAQYECNFTCTCLIGFLESDCSFSPLGSLRGGARSGASGGGTGSGGSRGAWRGYRTRGRGRSMGTLAGGHLE